MLIEAPTAGSRVGLASFVLLIVSTVTAASRQTRPVERDFVGCGSAEDELKIIKHDDLPMPEPSPGKAIVFFGLDLIQLKLGMDGAWVALTPPGAYSHFEVDPGIHRFCASVGTPGEGGYLESLLLLTAEEGRTYYLTARSNMGWSMVAVPKKARVELIEVTKEEWEKLPRRWGKRWKFVTFERKPS
jgi:hypothetical protein